MGVVPSSQKWPVGLGQGWDPQPPGHLTPPSQKAGPLLPTLTLSTPRPGGGGREESLQADGRQPGWQGLRWQLPGGAELSSWV